MRFRGVLASVSHCGDRRARRSPHRTRQEGHANQQEVRDHHVAHLVLSAPRIVTSAYGGMRSGGQLVERGLDLGPIAIGAAAYMLASYGRPLLGGGPQGRRFVMPNKSAETDSF